MRYILITLTALIPLSVMAAQNTVFTVVKSVEQRQSGMASVYVQDTIPDEGCDLTDRAVTNDVIWITQLSALAAEAVEAARQQDIADAEGLTVTLSPTLVQLRVNGCDKINPGTANQTTAPLIDKVQVGQP